MTALDWIDDASTADLVTLSRSWRQRGLEALAMADLLLTRAQERQSGCVLCGVDSEDECSMECPSRCSE